MFYEPQTNSPAFKAHFEAQTQLFTDMSHKFFDSAQKIGELNIQVAKTLMDESLGSVQQMMTVKNPFEAMTIAVTQAQPVADKVRAYQQHLTNIAAQSQVDIAKSAEAHVPNTARTASAVADEIAHKAMEETEKAAQRQEAAGEKMSASQQRSANASNGKGHSARGG
jgi:phasin family protein